MVVIMIMNVRLYIDRQGLLPCYGHSEKSVDNVSNVQTFMRYSPWKHDQVTVT